MTFDKKWKKQRMEIVSLNCDQRQLSQRYNTFPVVIIVMESTFCTCELCKFEFYCRRRENDSFHAILYLEVLCECIVYCVVSPYGMTLTTVSLRKSTKFVWREWVHSKYYVGVKNNRVICIYWRWRWFVYFVLATDHCDCDVWCRVNDWISTNQTEHCISWI